MALSKIWRVVVDVLHQNFDGLVDLGDKDQISSVCLQEGRFRGDVLLAAWAAALTDLKPTLLHCTHTSRVELDRV